MARLSLVCAATTIVATCFAPPASHAAGYDPTVAHTARYVGMAGTAIAYVDDPSALAHNPAGLATLRAPTVMAGLSVFGGQIRAVPEEDRNVDSEPVLAPLPLVAGAIPLTKRITLGAAAYPIAAAGAVYEYDGATGSTRDETRAAFVELTLGCGLSLPEGVRVGAGQRTTFAQLRRYKKGSDAAGPGIDLALAGVGFSGWRAGLQWEALSDGRPGHVAARRRILLGFAYRHRSQVSIQADEGTLLSLPAENVRTRLTLPSKWGIGVRSDVGQLGLAFDVERGLNSQNQRSEVRADVGTGELVVPAIYDWTDSTTLRLGAELRVVERPLISLRGGLIRDGRASSRAYPSPFAPPPTTAWAMTAGVGMQTDAWQASVAYALRYGSTTIREQELGEELCAFCGYAGEYAGSFHTVSADVVYQFD